MIGYGGTSSLATEVPRPVTTKFSLSFIFQKIITNQWRHRSSAELQGRVSHVIPEIDTAVI